MTTPSGKIIPPRQRKIALLGSRSVGSSLAPLSAPRKDNSGGADADRTG